MKRLFQRVFRPTYGERIGLRAKWWSPQDRRSARLAATLLDQHADVLREALIRHAREELLYGRSRYGVTWVLSADDPLPRIVELREAPPSGGQGASDGP
jgi:hypothetical protein